MPNRREFLKSSAGAGVLLGCASPAALAALASEARADAEVTPDLVRFTPDIEPIVRLIEETPREKCIEMMVGQLKRGLPYRNFLASLFLAGIRDVNPQPVGFKFHCVMAIHSANQLSLDAAPEDRLLPLFWALDTFKKSQADNERQGNIRMGKISGRLPAPEKAAAEFHAAMQAWDLERANRAVVAFVRNRGADEVIEAFWRYGARDFRDIGHKGIFVANSWRTLQTIGWQHAEPALRSLVRACLYTGRKNETSQSYDEPVYQANVERAAKALPSLPGNWTEGFSKNNEGATRDLLDAMRSGNSNDVCQKTVDELKSGKIQAQAAWDAIHLASGELIMRQPAILGIHAITSTNSLHYAFRTSSDPETRLLMLLHGVAWMCQFRGMITARGKLQPIKITELPAASVAKDGAQAAAQVLERIGADTNSAAACAFELARVHPQPDTYMSQVRRLIFRKGTDAHHYKYAAAILEDFGLVSPQWRPHMLATSVYYIKGSNQPDSRLMTQAIDAVRKA